MTLIQNEDAKYSLALFESENKYNQRKDAVKTRPESLYQDENFICSILRIRCA